MNSMPMSSNDGVYSLPIFSSSSLLFSFFLFRVYAFYSLVHRSDGYLRGKRKRISLTFLSIRVSTCRCGDVGNHLRSSPLVSVRSKVVVVVVMHSFSHSSCLCSVSSFSLSLSFVYSLSVPLSLSS